MLRTCGLHERFCCKPGSIAKLGGIPNLLAWLVKDPIPNLVPSVESKAAIERVQIQGAYAMLSLAIRPFAHLTALSFSSTVLRCSRTRMMEHKSVLQMFSKNS